MYRDDDFYILFGKISTLFSSLDFFVTSVILKLIKNPTTKKITNNTTLGQKLRILKSLTPSDVVDIEILNCTNSIINTAIIVSDDRNRFIHDLWVFNESNISQGIITKHRMTGLNDFELRVGEDICEYTLKDLDAEVQKILFIEAFFAELLHRLDNTTTE